MVVNTLIQQFIFHCQYEKNLSANTLKSYKIDLTQFLVFLKNKTDINEIDKNVIKEYIKEQIEQYKVKSAKRKIACIKAFFNFLEFEEIITISPFRKVRLSIKEPKILPQVLSVKEVEVFLRIVYERLSSITDKNTYSYREAIRNAVIIEMLFSTGIRVSELCGLHISNIDLETGYVKVKGKGSKERIIQICNIEANRLLIEYYNLNIHKINQTGYFFINRLGKPLSTQSVRFIIKNCTKQSNVTKRVTPHTFRHSFATLLLEEGVDIKYIQKLLGHSSIMTTQIYTHVSQSKQTELLTTKHPRQKMTLI